MSRPSIEGLRLALLDHEFCVTNQVDNPNHEPDIFLRSLQIAGMRHCGRAPGRPFRMEIHPNFNAIIGGRGTGKSTALESIRIVSRREHQLDETPKLKEDLEKFMKLSSNKGVMLNETELSLAIHRRGQEFCLHWRFDGAGHVLEEKIDGDWQPCDFGDLRERFPISIYSQKQINALASNPRGLLEILDRSQEVNRNGWEQRWESEKSKFLQLRERQREVIRKLSREPEIKAKLADVGNDLKQYEEKGHGHILKEYQTRSQQLRTMPLDDSFDDLAARIRELAKGVGASDFVAHVFSSDDPLTEESRLIHAETATALNNIQQELVGVAQKVAEISEERKKKLKASQWYQAIQNAVEAYQALVKEYEEKSTHIDLNLYGQWVQQRGMLQQEMARLEGLRKEAQTVQDQINNISTSLLKLRQELLNKRNNFITSVIGENSYVNMVLVPFGYTSTIDYEFRTTMGLDESRFKDSILDRENRQGLLWELYNWEEVVVETDIPNILHKLKDDTQKLVLGSESNVPSYVHGSFINRLQKNHEQQPANLDQLWCWWPEDLLRVQYARNSHKRKFEDMEKGSAGQKAAAILAFLLSHGNEPLIIDQPEDDLDNALIYDLVVQQIHENKNRRQLIVVTHNPNIVVNGDAELVHVLKYEGGQAQISDQGGLEEENIRNRICEIMEGGREQAGCLFWASMTSIVLLLVFLKTSWMWWKPGFEASATI